MNNSKVYVIECPQCKHECRYQGLTKVINDELSAKDGKEVVFYDSYRCVNGSCAYSVQRRIGN